MGFGLLFFGYFAAFLTSLNSYGFIFSLIGYYIIFISLQKISEYKHSLVRCLPSLAVMALCSLAEFVNFALESIGSTAFLSGDLALSVTSTLALISSVSFNLFLFTSIISLAEDTELPDVKSLSRFNIFATALYFAANVLAMLLKSVWDISNPYLSLAVILLRLFCPVLALILIYRCFYKICAPEDVDVPIKPSRFEFINKFRAKSEQRSRETAQIREDIISKNQERNRHKKNK